MTINKNQLLQHSEHLKFTALDLFGENDPYGGGDAMLPVFSLLHAASEIIQQTKGKPYKDSVFEAINILLHLEDCSGCNKEPEK